jgi:hypothetical protein
MFGLGVAPNKILNLKNLSPNIKTKIVWVERGGEGGAGCY